MCRNISPSVTHISPVHAFFASGRSMITVVTWPSRSTAMCSCSITPLPFEKSDDGDRVGGALARPRVVGLAAREALDAVDEQERARRLVSGDLLAALIAQPCGLRVGTGIELDDRDHGLPEAL